MSRREAPSVRVEAVTQLRFGRDDPVRAASGIAPFGDGWLVAQDDTNHAAWWRPSGIARIRLFPPTGGHDVFSEAAGTKHLKPDLEAACAVGADGGTTLLLGSGSLPARTRAALIVDGAGGPDVHTAELAPLYDAVAATLEIPRDQLNLEGACRIGDRIRWFQRGHGRSGVPSTSVDLDADAMLAAVLGDGAPEAVTPKDVRRYDLGTVGDLPLAITDAVALPDGRIVVSATAEDTPDPVADGPVSGSALALLDDVVVAVSPMPDREPPWKVEGLGLVEAGADGARLLAVMDQDDPRTASPAAELLFRW